MINFRNMSKPFYDFMIFSVICVFSVYLIMYSKQVSNAVITSINSCLTIIIPSLYAFLVVSNILIKSNIYIILSMPFGWISRYLFRIQPQLFSIFILSNIGGYPVGAKLLTDLYESGKIDKKTAENMMCYCYCNSPAFFSGAIGICLFGSVKVGLLAYFSVVISNILIAIFMGLKNQIPAKSKQKENIKLDSDILINSINNGFKTITMICFMLVFFSVIISFIDVLGVSDFLANKATFLIDDIIISKVSLFSFIEISQISNFSKNCYNILPLISSLASIGGLCVILQIISITSKKLSLKKFIVSRFACVILSAVICYVLKLMFLKDAIIQVSNFESRVYSPHHSFIPSICLIIMSFILLFSKKYRFYKEGVI